MVQAAIREIKAHVPDLAVITDVCLCEYTDHGHCGVIEGGDVDNDATLELLAREALSHARAGADIVAPSDMMDGRVGAIRKALDQNGFAHSADHGVLGQVRLRVLRPVPRGRRIDAEVRRPPLLPDGSAQRRRGDARGRARSRGRRGHRDGQAGAGLPGPDLPGEDQSSDVRSRLTMSRASTR